MKNNIIDNYTKYNGKTIEKTYKSIFIVYSICFFIGIYVLLNFTDGDADISFIPIFGTIPVVFASYIFQFAVYNKEYYQLSRFYQVSTKDVYRFNLKSMYSINNIVIIVGLNLIGDIILFLIFKTNLFSYLSPILFGYILSPVLVALIFITTTFYDKYSVFIKVIASIIIFTLVILITTLSILMEFNLNIIYAIVSMIIFVYIFDILSSFREKRMEC